jgi:hypothetical protein
MPVTLDLLRLVEMAQELSMMGSRGVQRKRLALIALDIMLSKAAASSIAERAAIEDERKRAQRALQFLNRLETEVVRMYATAISSRRLAHRVHLGVAFAAIPR